MKLLKRFFKEEDAQTMIEYILIVAVIAVGAITAFAFFRGKIAKLFSDLATRIFNAQHK